MKNLLEEGTYYTFFIEKTLLLPDHKEYFILKDPFSKKHLLLKQPYAIYKLTPGNYINCKVDKINCNGKIFLEPEHPYLKQEHRYEFEITCTEEIYTNMVDPEQTLFVKDMNGVEYQACANRYLKVEHFPSKIKAELVKISKAKLYLRIMD